MIAQGPIDIKDSPGADTHCTGMVLYEKASSVMHS